MTEKISDFGSSLSYVRNQLHFDNIDCRKIAKKYGTPIYCYSLKSIENSFNELKQSFKKIKPLICYAVKANHNKNILKKLSKLGSGADVVSLGELKQSLKCGIRPEKIVFSGVGKSDDELEFAIKKDIKQINVESEEEIVDVIKIAKKNDKIVKIVLRVNPDTDAQTHEKISTGRLEDKFGIPLKKVKSIYKKYKNYTMINIVGISVHIGSQIENIAPYKEAFNKVRSEIVDLKNLGFDVSVIDLGGGIGINYNNNRTLLIKDYSVLIERLFSDLGSQIILEPGRLMVGSSGIIITKIIRVKKGDRKNFLILNCGMNNLIRPSLYNAFHKIVPIKVNNSNKKSKFDIVGPICESSDVFAKDYMIQSGIMKDDLVVICSAGAYGACMSSTYNLREETKEICLEKGKLFK